MYILGGVIAVGFFAILFYLIYAANYEKEVGLVLGALVGAFSMVVSYFYGSSKGSSDKNELINK